MLLILNYHLGLRKLVRHLNGLEERANAKMALGEVSTGAEGTARGVPPFRDEQDAYSKL